MDSLSAFMSCSMPVLYLLAIAFGIGWTCALIVAAAMVVFIRSLRTPAAPADTPTEKAA